MNRPLASVRITDFDPSVTDELVPMWRASFEFGVGIVDTNPIEGQAEYFRTKVVPENRVRLAWEENELVAFLASTPESITLLHVKVSHIGRGIGTRLLQLAKDESSGSLWLYTFTRNERACGFYERHGFKVAQRGFEPFWQLEDVKYVWARPEGAASPLAQADALRQPPPGRSRPQWSLSFRGQSASAAARGLARTLGRARTTVQVCAAKASCPPSQSVEAALRAASARQARTPTTRTVSRLVIRVPQRVFHQVGRASPSHALPTAPSLPPALKTRHATA